MKNEIHGSPAGALALILLCTFLSGAARADASAPFVVEGRVLEAEPVLAERRFLEQVGDCDPAPPGPGAGLVDLLRWDLKADCREVWRTEAYVDGWRVRYEWEGAVFDGVFDEEPGERIRLLVTLH